MGLRCAMIAAVLLATATARAGDILVEDIFDRRLNEHGLTVHFAGSVDPASRCGAFGNEYHGDVPFMRWQITKLDLLCAQAVGYKLRETSAFVPVKIKSVSLPGGTVGKAYKGKIDAAGGVPFYRWDVSTGALPTGFELDSFAGAFRGTPKAAGVSEFTIRVRNYDEKSHGQTRKLRIEIAPAKSAAVAR
jgi:Putative Ig domain